MVAALNTFQQMTAQKSHKTQWNIVKDIYNL